MPTKQLDPRKIDKEIGPAITRIKKIKYFLPERTLEEADYLVPKVEELIAAHEEALRPWKQEGQSWGEAEGAVRDAVRDAARDAVTYAVEVAVRDAARSATWNVVGGATGDAARGSEQYTVFELVKGRKLAGFENRQNPYDSILRMYERGLKPDRFRDVDGEEKFVVDFPLPGVNTKLNILGCYVEGDKSLQWYHRWTDYDHSNLTSLKFAPRKIA